MTHLATGWGEGGVTAMLQGGGVIQEITLYGRTLSMETTF